MKTWIKVVLGLVILGVLAFAGYTAYMIFRPSTTDFGTLIEYHTKDELTELYSQNKELLNSVRDSVLSSKSLLRALDEYKEGDVDISFQSDKKYFSDEEWADILSVFDKFHPYMILMERKGRPLIFYMAFGHLKQGSTTYANYLYWFPNEEEREYHEEPNVFPDGVFTQLDEGWYIVETAETR